jgi:hypothetical protein
MRKTVFALAVVTSLGMAGSASAQGLSQTHDGFYLRMDAGGGSLKSTASSGGIDMELSGTAGQFSISLGGAISPNFIIGGHLWGGSVSSPDVKVNGQSFSTTGSPTLSLSAIGVDLTYYFMPINIYLTATPSIGMLSIKANGQTFDTKNGFAIRLAAGKEWWVSDNWGLGFNVNFAHSSNEDQGTNPPTWSSNLFGVALSATFN